MLKQLINYESKENTISKLNIKFTNFRVKSQNHKNHSFITNLKDLKINKIDRTYKSMIQQSAEAYQQQISSKRKCLSIKGDKINVNSSPQITINQLHQNQESKINQHHTKYCMHVFIKTLLIRLIHIDCFHQLIKTINIIKIYSLRIEKTTSSKQGHKSHIKKYLTMHLGRLRKLTQIKLVQKQKQVENSKRIVKTQYDNNCKQEECDIQNTSEVQLNHFQSLQINLRRYYRGQSNRIIDNYQIYHDDCFSKFQSKCHLKELGAPFKQTSLNIEPLENNPTFISILTRIKNKKYSSNIIKK